MEGIILEKLPLMRQRLTAFVSSWRGPFTLFKSTSVDTTQQTRAADKKELDGPK